jgi:uncharacterized protein YgiM (DUF1202 family)
MSFRRVACLGLVLLAASVTLACKHADGEAEAAGESATGAAAGDVEMLPMEIVTAKSLNVRALPSTKGTVLGTLKQGQEVRVLEVQKGWKKVQSDGAAPEGWVAGEYLKAHGAK